MTAPTGMTRRQPHFETVATIFERVKANVALRTTAPRFAFGLPSLDQATHGLRPGKLTILAARTSEGKTSLALQTAASLAKAGHCVAYISIEDDREQLVEKLYCQEARVAHRLLQEGRIEALAHAGVAALFETLHLVVLDNFGYTLAEIREVLERLDPAPSVVVLDYVQLIDQPERLSEYEALSRFVRDAKVFVEHSKIGLLLLSQINRQGARDGRPELHHLASCGRLEQVADLVLLLFCPYLYRATSADYIEALGRGMKAPPADYVELCVAKNKTGPRNQLVRLRFDGPTYHFEEWRDDQSV